MLKITLKLLSRGCSTNSCFSTALLYRYREPSFRGLSLPQTRYSSSTMSSLKNKSDLNLVWIDMEMTGLDPVNDQILEVACLVTDGSLKTVAEHPSVVIHQPDSVLNSMNEWCMENHNKTGLVAASQRSNVSLQDAEKQILEFIEKYAPAGKCPLAGNSVYMDRLFLRQHMPLVEKHLHYRIVDVSTIKELCRRWYPEAFAKAPRKKLNHRATMDIKESIQELRYYRSSVFLNTP